MKRIPGLDGIRGCAVLAVMGFHTYLSPFALGWAGVNCFFVLSGFLITGILIRAKAQSRFFSTFYARRALRIFPAYYLMLAVIFIWAVARELPVGDGPFFLFYLQNFAYAARGFDVSFPVMAAHTWSLAVEEQFYLLWPCIVWFLSVTALRRVVIGIIVAGPLMRVIIGHFSGGWMASYVLLPGEADMLAWGALGAVAFLPKPRIILAAAVVLIVIFAVRGGYDWLGASMLQSAGSVRGSLFFSLLGAASLALILIAKSEGATSRILDFSPLRYAGKISYGLYLYHFPIYQAAAALHFNATGTIVTEVFGTFAVASLSFFAVEQPLLKLKNRLFPTPSAAPADISLTAPEAA